MRMKTGLCWLMLVLAACAPQTPAPRGTPITIDQGGTVNLPGKGELTVEPGGVQENVRVSLEPVAPPPEPEGITGGFEAMSVRISGLDLGGFKPQETAAGCKIRLRLSYPASTPNPETLRMYQVEDATLRKWTMVAPYQLHPDTREVEACLPLLKDRDTYTLGSPKRSNTPVPAQTGGTVLANPDQAGQLVVAPGTLPTDLLINLNQVVPPRKPLSQEKALAALLLETRAAQVNPGVRKAALECPLQLTLAIPAGTPNMDQVQLYRVTDQGWVEVRPVVRASGNLTACLDQLRSSDLYVLSPSLLKVSFTTVPARLRVGSTFNLQARAQIADGPVLPGKTFNWTSSNPEVAEIQPGQAYGSATVTVKRFGAVQFTVDVEGKTATTPVFNTHGLLVSGGTSQDVTGAQLQEVWDILIRSRFVPAGNQTPAAGQLTLTGPTDWNNNQPLVLNWTPSSTMQLNNLQAPPVSGMYSYSYNDGTETHQGTFMLDATQKIERPGNLQVKPVFGQNQMVVTLEWQAPAGAHLESQQGALFALNPFTGMALTRGTGPSPLTLQAPYGSAQSFAACVFAWSQPPLTTDLLQQVNEAARCQAFRTP